MLDSINNRISKTAKRHFDHANYQDNTKLPAANEPAPPLGEQTLLDQHNIVKDIEARKAMLPGESVGGLYEKNRIGTTKWEHKFENEQKLKGAIRERFADSRLLDLERGSMSATEFLAAHKAKKVELGIDGLPTIGILRRRQERQTLSPEAGNGLSTRFRDLKDANDALGPKVNGPKLESLEARLGKIDKRYDAQFEQIVDSRLKTNPYVVGKTDEFLAAHEAKKKALGVEGQGYEELLHNRLRQKFRYAFNSGTSQEPSNDGTFRESSTKGGFHEQAPRPNGSLRKINPKLVVGGAMALGTLGAYGVYRAMQNDKKQRKKVANYIDEVDTMPNCSPLLEAALLAKMASDHTIEMEPDADGKFHMKNDRMNWFKGTAKHYMQNPKKPLLALGALAALGTAGYVGYKHMNEKQAKDNNPVTAEGAAYATGAGAALGALAAAGKGSHAYLNTMTRAGKAPEGAKATARVLAEGAKLGLSHFRVLPALGAGAMAGGYLATKIMDHKPKDVQDYAQQGSLAGIGSGAVTGGYIGARARNIILNTAENLPPHMARSMDGARIRAEAARVKGAGGAARVIAGNAINGAVIGSMLGTTGGAIQGIGNEAFDKIARRSDASDSEHASGLRGARVQAIEDGVGGAIVGGITGYGIHRTPLAAAVGAGIGGSVGAANGYLSGYDRGVAYRQTHEAKDTPITPGQVGAVSGGLALTPLGGVVGAGTSWYLTKSRKAMIPGAIGGALLGATAGAFGGRRRANYIAGVDN